MSENTTMLIEAAGKMFADLCTRQALDAAESAFPQTMWADIEAGGFPAMLASESDGGIAAAPSDAVAVLRVAGRHSVPLPLAETMVARWLMSEASVAPIAGPLTIALGSETQRCQLKGRGRNRTLHGREDAVAWARDAKSIVVIVPKAKGVVLCMVEPSRFESEARRNIAGEPRDRIAANGIVPGAVAALDNISIDKVLCMAALFRAALSVGALGQVLDLCVKYTPERIQFGRPLSRLQAIQQQLAVLAGSVAASAAITEAAGCTVNQLDGKLMVAVARSRVADAIDTATGIAHQVHGAIGFAREYMLHFSTRRLWAWRDEYGAAVAWREFVGRTFVGTPADELWPALAAVGSNG